MLIIFMHQSVKDGTLLIRIILLRNLLALLLLIRTDTNVVIELWQNVTWPYVKLSGISYVLDYTEQRQASV